MIKRIHIYYVLTLLILTNILYAVSKDSAFFTPESKSNNAVTTTESGHQKKITSQNQSLSENDPEDEQDPELLEDATYVLCDIYQTGKRVFNLNSKNQEILNGVQGIITYHLTQETAESGASAIPNPTSYNSTNKTLYVRVVTSDLDENGEPIVKYTTLDLIVALSDVAEPTMLVSSCNPDNPGVGIFDLNSKINEILNGETATVTFYPSLAEAENDENAIANPQNYQTQDTTIYVRIEHESGCFITRELALKVGQVTARVVAPLRNYTDPNNNGIVTWQPAQVNNAINQAVFGNLNDVMATVHINEASAHANINIVNAPFTNLENYFDTFYIRVQDVNNPNCYAITPLYLMVTNPSPPPSCPLVIANDPPPVCTQYDEDGNVIPHEVLLDAEYYEVGKTNQYTVESIPFQPPFPFFGGAGIELNIDDAWSGIVDLGFDFCFFENEYTKALITGNGALTFSINSPANGLTGRYSPNSGAGYVFDTPYGVPLYASSNTRLPYSSAIFGVLQDTNPNTNTNASPAHRSINYQIIGVAPCRTLVFNIYEVGQFSCNQGAGLQTSQMVIYETTNVVEVYVQKRTPCNSWEGGRGVIGIQNEAGTVGYTPPGRNVGNWSAFNEAWRFRPAGESMVDFGWYKDGELISTNRQLLVSVTESTMYVAQAKYRSCYNDPNKEIIKKWPVFIELVPRLEAGEASDIEQCSNVFDLNQASAGLFDGDIHPNDIAEVNFFFTKEAAEDLNNFDRIDWMINPDTNDYYDITQYPGQDGEVLWARVTPSGNPNCIISRPFTLHIEDCSLRAPDDYAVCDNDNNGSELVDLTLYFDELNDQFDTDYTFSFHLSEQDALDNENPINLSMPFEAALGNTQIWVRGESTTDPTATIEYDHFNIVVYAPPTINMDVSDYVVCGNIDGQAEFDLTIKVPEITELDPEDPLYTELIGELEITYYESELDAINTTNPIEDPSSYTSATSTIWVRVVDANGCYSITSFNIVASTTLPINQDTTDYALCGDLNGEAIFDLTSKSEEILNGVAGEVTFYNSQADAISGTNAIANPNSYTSNGETIWVRVENASGCFDTTSFEIVISDPLSPNPNVMDYQLCETADGVAIFDLTSKNEEILAGLTAEVTFYNSQADAQTGSNPIAATTAYESAGETIWVRVENEDGCFGVTSFDLVVVASPIINTNVTNYVLCDFNADGQASFDLTSKAEEILNGAGATLTYYTSEANANQATQAIANTTAYSAADGSVIWVRAEIEGGCYSITSFTLEVTPNEVIADAAPIELCRNNNQGNVIFDLTQAGTALVTDASDVVTYHTTLQAAQQGVAAINNTTAYAISSTQTVYIRIESETACPKISSVQLVVMPAPALATTITNYVLCEEADQMASFDLTSKTNEILAGSTATISFYASAADLENNNPIADPTAYLSGSATIWVKAENAEGCFSTRTFNLVVNNLPVTYAPDPIYVCNDGTGFGSFNLNIRNQQIAGSIPGLQVTYHLTLADAQNNINHLSSPYNGTHEQVLYVRVANGFGCVDTTQTLTLYLEDSTINPALDPLYMCDPNSDGWGVFDLTQVEATIIAANPNPVTITYHETYLDAQFAANVIPNPTTYFNIAHQSQTIYVLITPASGNACATIGTVELIVNNLPLINKNLDPIALCDDNTDGLATFDLTQAVAQVLGNLDPALHTVEFYSSEADARGANNPIANPTNYVNTLAGQDQVWIRVSHIDSGCFDVVALDLIVHPLPNVAQPNVPAYHLCDSDEDGFEVFDLESYIDIITQGQSGLAVSYHITYEEALSGTNAITNLQFTNQAQYVQTIFVRVETENGCSVVTLLDLVTDPLPVLATPEPIVVCDPDADGFGNVDLSLALDQLLNGANPADYQITFHETYTDAQYGQAAIDPITSYFNIDPFTQVIYVRVATTAESGCTNIYPLTIVVEPAPILPTDPDNTLPALEICDTNTDGFAYFDLTQQTTYILDNTVSNTANLVVTYHLTQADAEQGVMAITNVTNYLNLSNPQTLWVRLASSVTECFDVASFELIVNVPLTLPTSIQPITICDTDRDGINVYDLTVRIPAILANATNPANYTVDFFPSYAEALAGENQIQNPEAYTSDLHVRSIGVRVTDNTTGCVSYWFFDIRRAPMPNVPPTPTQPLTVCDVTPGANGQDDFIESFDLTVYEEFLRQGDTYLILTYHTSEQDAIDGVNAIADPTDFVSGDTTIYVRVANQPNMGVSCFEIVSFDIVVEPLPLVADNSFEVCEVGSTGFAEFNFLEFNPQLLGPTQELSDFTISYHPTQADAEANTNAISQTTPYQNTSQYAESIWVRIVNIETTCTRVAEITLFAEEGATATQPAQGMFVCDEFDGANDGFTSFDLTAVEAEVLNGQDPAQFAVSYHTTEADANVNANPITTPEDFINTIQGGQTIYIRVENTATNAPCYAVTTLEIVAEQLAEPVITASAPTLCVDWGNTLANDPVILDSGITATGYTFEWYHNGTLVEDENQATLTLTEIGQEGTYEVIAISQNGCISEISESFQVLLSGKASLVSVMTSNAFQGNQNIIVTVEGNGVYAFQLDNGPIQDNGFFADVAPGTHTVTVYDIVTGDINQTYSCATLVISDIQLVDYMKFFTPNGDGYNDYWKITGLNEDHNAEIYIFDRYGKLLKQLNPLGEGWDGTFNGNPLPSTDYWFKVIYNETDLENNIARKEFRAHFSLKR